MVKPALAMSAELHTMSPEPSAFTQSQRSLLGQHWSLTSGHVVQGGGSSREEPATSYSKTRVFGFTGRNVWGKLRLGFMSLKVVM